MKNVLFIAPPAGGKGLQSSLLVQNLNYKHISSGDLLRKNMDADLKAKMSSGKLIDDETVINLIKKELITLSDEDHFILDGFPRTVSQAIKLEEMLKAIGKTLDAVILLDVPYDICLKRVLGRMNCPSCNKSYNKYFLKPIEDGICDDCHEMLSTRSDDNEETFKKRYDIYLENANDLIDYYTLQNKLIKIDNLDNTFDIIVSVINNG